MNIRQLEIFGAVMQTGSTVGAAKVLNVTQPAVSIAIKHLEDQLKVELFLRKHGRLIPTPDARLIYDDARIVFEAFETVRFTATRLKDAQIGALTIACTTSLAETLVPTALEHYHDRHPDVTIALNSGTVEYVWRSLSLGEADVGVFYTEPDTDTMHISRLARVDLICAMPKGHPLEKLPVLKPSDLEGHKMISLSKSYWLGPVITSAFESYDAESKGQFEVRFLHTAQRLVAHGLGIAIVDSFQLFNAEENPNVVYRPFEPRIATAAYAAFPKNRPVSRLARSFVSSMETSLAGFEERWSEVQKL